ncbi:MAG: hypothetical protein A2016_04945 [Elusimicrobia bacterium GWF2_62_30]|nr:MAG: hypothetical protein A2016_04945 [Elusimicrobia bacterium GWF2_62_30]
MRRLDSPRKLQDFLDYDIAYNGGEDSTCLSVSEVLRQRRAHCIEGAMLAAAAFLLQGRKALLLDLRANPRDDDHVIAPFTENGRWGAVAKSCFCGLRYREPVYRSFGELARSYFEFYYNDTGEKTLREFSAPFEVSRLKPDWLCSEKNVFYVSRKLDALRHTQMVPYQQQRRLRRADSLLRQAEIIGCTGAPLTKSSPRPYRKRQPR